MEIKGPNPFHRYAWTGRILSCDGTPTTDWYQHEKEDEPAQVIACADTGWGWDGNCAGIARLRDGRYVAWETTWGPTGDGFCCDAYGGDADIHVGSTLDAVIWMGLSAEGRTLLGYPAERPEED